ncbi:hypothetical protein D3C71_1678920 [compost metagenome]
MAATAIVDHQVDPFAHQLAEVGHMTGGRLAGEQCGLAKGPVAVPVAGGDADFQPAQIGEAVEWIGVGPGVEQHELDLRQRFVGKQHRGFALRGAEDVQDAVGLALFQCQQAASPRQQLPFDLDAQALQDGVRGFVIEAAQCAVVVMDIGRPGFADNAQRLSLGRETQAGEQQGGD